MPTLVALRGNYEASRTEALELGLRRAAHVYVASSKGIGGKDEAIEKLKLAALEWAVEFVKAGGK